MCSKPGLGALQRRMLHDVRVDQFVLPHIAQSQLPSACSRYRLLGCGCVAGAGAGAGAVAGAVAGAGAGAVAVLWRRVCCGGMLLLDLTGGAGSMPGGGCNVTAPPALAPLFASLASAAPSVAVAAVAAAAALEVFGGG